MRTIVSEEPVSTILRPRKRMQLVLYLEILSSVCSVLSSVHFVNLLEKENKLIRKGIDLKLTLYKDFSVVALPFYFRLRPYLCQPCGC
jgi:hypothetical protein